MPGRINDESEIIAASGFKVTAAGGIGRFIS